MEKNCQNCCHNNAKDYKTYCKKCLGQCQKEWEKNDKKPVT